MLGLTQTQKRYLKQKAHELKPVVIVGNAGLGENVLHEIDIALEHHELIKVRLNAANKQERIAMSGHIESELNAHCIQIIGHIGVFYRPAVEPRMQLP